MQHPGIRVLPEGFPETSTIAQHFRLNRRWPTYSIAAVFSLGGGGAGASRLRRQAAEGAVDMFPHFRVARPVTDIRRTETMYRAGLSLARLGHFEDHDGFDGVMLGAPGGTYHFEFTYCRTHPVAPMPTPEDLCVFYVPDRDEWQERCRLMEAAGFRSVKSLNPYWETNGRTFEDLDGYRTVIQCALWESAEEL